MTNMQLAYSEFLENARHNRVAEDTSRMDVVEKQRHNTQTEQLTAAQQSLDKYLGELSNDAKMKEIASKADIEQLRIMTNKAIEDAKLNLSNKEYANLKRKTTAEINHLQAMADKNQAEMATIKDKSKAQIALWEAQAAKANADAYGTIRGLVAATVGPLANSAGKTATEIAKSIITPEPHPENTLQRRYAVASTGGKTTPNTYNKTNN